MHPQPKLPDAWSYSAWAMYDQCPSRYHGAKVLKLAEPPSRALEEGNAFHVQIAAYVRGHRPGLPERPIHERIMPIVEQLKATEDKIVEEQWGFDREWKPTGWFTKGPKQTWLRVILDAFVAYEDNTGIAGDWKTGKRYDSNDDQMELFGCSTLTRFPALNEVETRLWYVDNGAEECATFKRSELPALRAKWDARAVTMLSDREWRAKPNDKCRFCVRARQNGGDCKFG